MAECVIKMSTCSFRMKSQSCNLAASYERNIPYTCFTNESRTFSTPKTTLRDSARSEPMIRDRSPISGTRGDNVVLTLFHSATKSACIAYRHATNRVLIHHKDNDICGSLLNGFCSKGESVRLSTNSDSRWPLRARLCVHFFQGSRILRHLCEHKL